MKLSSYQIRKFRDSLYFVLIGATTGALFAVAMSFVLAESDGIPEDFYRFVFLGFFTGMGISVCILVLNALLSKYRSQPLWFSLFMVPLLQSLIILCVYGAVFSLLFGFELFHVTAYPVPTFIFSFSLTAVLNFYSDIERLLGRHVLRGLLLCTYKRPKHENRFVMFLDIAGSTSIAERIGDISFHAFLNDFFCDIGPVIVNHRGNIYKYVGDEVIITWTEKEGRSDSRALLSCKAMAERIKKAERRYVGRYGEIPVFRCSLHYGSLVAGEMGLTRQEIAFSGDVMNTAARIQAECRPRGESFLASDACLSLFPPNPAVWKSIPQGPVSLRGKKGDISISAVRFV